MSHSQFSTTCVEKSHKKWDQMWSQRSSKPRLFLLQSSQAVPATVTLIPLTSLSTAQNCPMQSSYHFPLWGKVIKPIGTSCAACVWRRWAVRMRPCAMQHGEDAVLNDHVTKTGKLRDKIQLNSPSRVCLAAPKARMGSRNKVYIHQGEKSKSLTFTKVRNPYWLHMPLFRS